MQTKATPFASAVSQPAVVIPEVATTQQAALVNIKTIVFAGGGAKGVGMPGTYLALQTAGIWPQIEVIAGSSVGSISAAIFAVSPSLARLQNLLLDRNLLEVFGMRHLKMRLNMSTEPIERFLNDHFLFAIKDHLAQHHADLLSESQAQDLTATDCQTQQLASQNLCAALLALYDNCGEANYAVTFRDLAQLHQKYPSTFKKLIVTSVSFANQQNQLHLYNELKTPDYSVARACAASSALPLVFAPVLINGVEHKDGCCEELLPTEYFEDDSEQQRASRLLFVFGDGPSNVGPIWKNAMHGLPNASITWLASQTEIQHHPRASRENDLQIYVWIDSTEANVHYLIRATAISDIENQLTFAELGISETPDALTAARFKAYHNAFYTKLALNDHIPSVLSEFSMTRLLPLVGGLVRKLLGVNLDAHGIFETTSQRIKNLYPFNTIRLHNTISVNGFEQAEQLKHIVTALYYLDTMNHLALYNMSEQVDESFYVAILQNYLSYYQTYLCATGVAEDAYLVRYSSEKEHPRFLYEAIKDDASMDHSSPRAFCLALAVEQQLGMKDDAAVLNAINTRVSAGKVSRKWFGRTQGHVFIMQNQLATTSINILPASENDQLICKM